MSGTSEKKEKKIELEVRINKYTSYIVTIPKAKYCDEDIPLCQVRQGDCVQGTLSILPTGQVEWKTQLISAHTNADNKIVETVLKHRREICEAYSYNRSLAAAI